jgi:tRNA(fMet)-specific endonuclease VapC
LISTRLLDTNAVSDEMYDHPKVKARMAAQAGPVVTSIIVVGEIRYGLARLPAGKRRTDLEVKAARILSILPIEPITEQVADTYGRIKYDLEARGLPLNDNDLWTAATALALGAVLVTRDTDFAQVPGLQVEDWTQ